MKQYGWIMSALLAVLLLLSSCQAAPGPEQTSEPQPEVSASAAPSVPEESSVPEVPSVPEMDVDPEDIPPLVKGPGPVLLPESEWAAYGEKYGKKLYLLPVHYDSARDWVRYATPAQLCGLFFYLNDVYEIYDGEKLWKEGENAYCIPVSAIAETLQIFLEHDFTEKLKEYSKYDAKKDGIKTATIGAFGGDISFDSVDYVMQLDGVTAICVRYRTSISGAFHRIYLVKEKEPYFALISVTDFATKADLASPAAGMFGPAETKKCGGVYPAQA